MKIFTAIRLSIAIVGLILTPYLVSADNKVTSSLNSKEMIESNRLNEQALNLFNEGKIKQAISIWEKAAKMAIIQKDGFTANAEVLNNLGFAYYKLGRRHYPAAIETLQRALVVDSNRWTTYLNLGDLYKSLGERTISVENYEKALDLNPNYKYANELKKEIAEFNSKYVIKMKAKDSAEISTKDEQAPQKVMKAKSHLTGSSYFYRIHHDLPKLKLILYLDDKMAPRHIDIFRNSNGKAIQVLDVNDSEDINYHCDNFYGGGQGRLNIVDMNFDGYQDLKLDCMAGQHQSSYLFWLYDKTSGSFIFNSDLSDLGDPKPQGTNVITEHEYPSDDGMNLETRVYKFIGNKLILIDIRNE